MADIPIVVDSCFRLPLQSLPREVDENLRAEFTHKNPAFHRANRFSRWQTKEPEYLALWAKDDGVLSLPRGRPSAIRDVLREHGLTWKWIDRRTGGNPGFLPAHISTDPKSGWDSWQHQDEIVEGFRRRQNCLVRSSTGSGKTSAALMAIAELGVETLVMVYSGALAEQWVSRAEVELGIPRAQVGRLGGGKKKFAPLTIAMQQTMMRMSDDEWADIDARFGAIVVDEVQMAAARTFTQVIGRSSAKYRLGISADESRKDGKEFLIYDMFGDVEVDVSFDALVKRGIIHDVEIIIVPTEFEASFYSRSRETGDTPDFNKLLDKMIPDEARNRLAAEVALREVQIGNQVVLFSQRRDHARLLNGIAADHDIISGTMLGGGGDDAEEFANSVRRMKARELQWATGTLQAVGQGLDIPSVSAGVVCTPIAFNRQLVNQVRGRLCRKHEGKHGARLYYLWDERVFGNAPVKSLDKHFNKVSVLVDDLGKRATVSVAEFFNRRRELRDGKSEKRIGKRSAIDKFLGR